MTIHATICYIIKDGKVLLLKKSKGRFGEGKWNAPGGKIKLGEDPVECAIREVFEETGLRINDVKKHGVIDYYFGTKSEPTWTVHIFSTNSFQGELKPSDEGILKWVNLNELPYEEMWEDDRHWVPLLLEDKKFKAEFYFDNQANVLLDHRVEEVSS